MFEKVLDYFIEKKALLTTIALVFCYLSGLPWIAQYPAGAMAVFSKIRLISYLMFAVLALHTLTVSLMKYQREKKCGMLKAVLLYVKDHLFLTLWAVMSVGVLASTHHTQPLIFLLMLLSMADTGFDQHIRPVFCVHLVFMAATIALHKFGILPQVVIERADGTIRSSLGYIYPLELQGHFLFLILMYVYIRRNRFRLPDFLVLMVLNYGLYRITDARTDFLSAVLVIISAYGVNLIGHEKVMKHLHLWFWEIYTLLIVGVPFYLGLHYSKWYEFWLKLDRILSYRLYYTKIMFDQEGVTLFGNVINWVGLGGNGVATEEYNWIDFSFVKDMLDYGIVFLVLFVLAFLFMYALCFRRRNVFGVIMLSGLLLSAMIEYHTFLPSVYPVILLMADGILMTNKEQFRCFIRKKTN